MPGLAVLSIVLENIAGGKATPQFFRFIIEEESCLPVRLHLLQTSDWVYK